MSNRIDQLFKNTLGEHKISPSEESWAKVKSGLTKKNKIIVVWRLAAVFVLMGALVGSWYFLNPNEKNNPTQLTEKNELATPDRNEIDKAIESTSEINKPDIAQTTETKSRKGIKKTTAIKTDTRHKTDQSLTIDNGEIENQVDKKITITESVSIVQNVKPEKPIVIEFTLVTISKAEPVAIAQTSEEENSGLKKVLVAALDMKNGDSDFGIIRDAKNQLLALDFKKDKTKRN